MKSKLMIKFIDLMSMDEQKNRLSILEPTVFLLIKEHPESSKMNIAEIIYGKPSPKSSIDRPIANLLKWGLIEKLEKPHAVTKAGEGRVLYRLTKKGESF